MTRTIHPIGQGAFYSESISKDSHALFTAVYDCGGERDSLRKEVAKLSRVDIVFISHFHCDHINHVQPLIQQFAPKEVVFPQISPSRFFVDFVFNYMKDKTGRCCSFMLHFLPILRTFSSGNEHSMTKDGTRYVPIKSSGMEHPVPSGLPIWEYLAFYKEDYY